MRTLIHGRFHCGAAFTALVRAGRRGRLHEGGNGASHEERDRRACAAEQDRLRPGAQVAVVREARLLHRAAASIT